MKFQVKIFSGSKDTEGDGRTDRRTDGHHDSYTGCPDPLAPPEARRLGDPMHIWDTFSENIVSMHTFCKF